MSGPSMVDGRIASRNRDRQGLILLSRIIYRPSAFANRALSATIENRQSTPNMAKYSQAGRLLAVSTPLGPDALLLERLSGTEAISALFSFRLDMLAPRDQPVAFDGLLGQAVTVAVAMPAGTRYFNGIVRRLSEGGEVHGAAEFVRYQAEIVPKLWLLTRSFRSRIFQQIAVPDILKKVLAGLDVSWQLQGKYQPRDYCVQYRESDFAFASRLMEDEGIYYYFKHTDGSHQLVVADTPQSHADVPGPQTLDYEAVIGGTREEDRILVWQKTQEVRTGKYLLRDHCFEKPDDNLEASRPILDSVTAGTVAHKLKAGGADKLEAYDYPGGYAGRFDGVTPGG